MTTTHVNHGFIKWLKKLKLSFLLGRATRLRLKLEITESAILDHLKKHTPMCDDDKRANRSPSSTYFFKEPITPIGQLSSTTLRSNHG